VSLNGIVFVANTTEAGSTTSGALRVYGGAGIGGNIFVGGNAVIRSNLESASTTSGALQVVGGAGIGGNVYVGGNLTVTRDVSLNGIVFVANNTQAGNTTSGALRVYGGVGIGGNLCVGGSVGIGKDNSAYKLDISGNLNIAGGNSNANFEGLTITTTANTLNNVGQQINFKCRHGTNSTIIPQASIQTIRENNSLDYSSGLGFSTSTTSDPPTLIEKMRIKANGYVGINTTNPLYLLDVSGTVNITGQLNTSTINNNGSIFLDGLTGGGWLQSETRGIGYASYDTARRSGINGFSGMDIQSVTVTASNNYSQNLRFWTHLFGSTSGTNPRMFIKHDGNIGIGTTSPVYLLDVNGTGNFSGLLTVNSGVTTGNSAKITTKCSTATRYGEINTNSDGNTTFNIISEINANGYYFMYNTTTQLLRVNPSEITALKVINANDGLSVTGTASVSSLFYVGGNSSATTYMRIEANSNNNGYIDLKNSGSFSFRQNLGSSAIDAPINCGAITASGTCVAYNSTSATSGAVFRIEDGASDTAGYGALQITRGDNLFRAHLSFVRLGNRIWQFGYIYDTAYTNDFGFFGNGYDTTKNPVVAYFSDRGMSIMKKTLTTGFALDVNGAVNATSYNAGSDYRIKENIKPISGTIDILNPVQYYNKNTEKEDMGFIAHEVQEHFPFLVNGEKDGKDMQSLNYIGLIALLTKEIQYLKKENRKMKSRFDHIESLLTELISKK